MSTTKFTGTVFTWFSSFSCRFLNPNYFFQFEFWMPVQNYKLQILYYRKLKTWSTEIRTYLRINSLVIGLFNVCWGGVTRLSLFVCLNWSTSQNVSRRWLRDYISCWLLPLDKSPILVRRSVIFLRWCYRTCRKPYFYRNSINKVRFLN